ARQTKGEADEKSHDSAREAQLGEDQRGGGLPAGEQVTERGGKIERRVADIQRDGEQRQHQRHESRDQFHVGPTAAVRISMARIRSGPAQVQYFAGRKISRVCVSRLRAGGCSTAWAA